MTKKSNKLIKSKKRVKEHGEVFTPPELVNEMLDKLPIVQFTDPTKTFIDPACGNGNFLVEVLRRKLSNGSTPLQALETTYGIDIMPDNIVECRQRLLKIAYPASSAIAKDAIVTLKRNIALADSLKFEMDDIFSSTPSDELKQFRQQRVECAKQQEKA